MFEEEFANGAMTQMSERGTHRQADGAYLQNERREMLLSCTISHVKEGLHSAVQI